MYLEGQLQTRKWQDKDGQDKYSTEVVLRGFGGTLVMLDGKGERDDGPVMDRGQQGRDTGGAGGSNLDDDLPF